MGTRVSEAGFRNTGVKRLHNAVRTQMLFILHGIPNSSALTNTTWSVVATQRLGAMELFSSTALSFQRLLTSVWSAIWGEVVKAQHPQIDCFLRSAVTGLRETNRLQMGDKPEVQIRDHKDLLERQDCLSCKVFGSTACLAMAGYTAYWSLRQQAQYRGITRLSYVASCLALASGLTYLGVRRIFD